MRLLLGLASPTGGDARALFGVEVLKLRTTRLWFALLIPALLIPALLLAGVAAAATIAAAGTPEGRAQGVERLSTVADLRELIYIGSVVTAFTFVLGATSLVSSARTRQPWARGSVPPFAARWWRSCPPSGGCSWPSRLSRDCCPTSRAGFRSPERWLRSGRQRPMRSGPLPGRF
jgi:hypothetical protein